MTTIPPNPEEALVTISTPQSDTVRVRDRVESSRFEFYFDDDVEIEPASTEELYFPLDIATYVRDVQEFIIPVYSAIIIHDHSTGKILEENVSDIEDTTLPEGDYEIEVASTPMKVYIRVSSAAQITRSANNVTVSLATPGDIIIGVRSHHERPAGTITTPRNIDSVMAAVSHFGSALKTLSPERSWPTLRGYPPHLELGKEFEIPEQVTKPDTGLELYIPRTIDAVFKTAPLTYYLAANLKPMPESCTQPYLSSSSTKIPLVGNLSNAALRLLQKNFLLDCIVRTEGLYSIDIEERQLVEGKLPWNPDTVYDLPLQERVVKYDEVPDQVLEEIMPTWPLTIDAEADFNSVAMLPHLAEELARVRIPGAMNQEVESTPTFVDDFVRADGGGTRAAERALNTPSPKPQITSPPEWDTQMHVSLLDGYPIGTNKTSLRAYDRHIDLDTPENNTITVHVVCNDDEMREEEVVTDLYGVRDLLEFEVNFHYKLSRSELRLLLERRFDLVHYIGHIDEEGILCADGYLDVRTDIDEVGVDAFILNACTSVEQGEALLEYGAVGGIATLFDVPNSSATRVGRSLSRLLNRGFPIRAALNIARESSVLGRRWVSLGDGRVSLTQPEGAFASIINIDPREDGNFNFELECFESRSHRIGSVVVPTANWGTYRVMPNRPQSVLSAEELEEVFSLEVSPVRCNGELYWTDETRPEDLRE